MKNGRMSTLRFHSPVSIARPRPDTIAPQDCSWYVLWRSKARIGMVFAPAQLPLGDGGVANSKFFDERTDQSEVKARIVQKHFFAWARVIIPTAKNMGNRIAYIDLYAGPGRYNDGAASTPLMVLEAAIQDEDLSKMLVCLFNDKDANHTQTLQEEIDKLPGIDALAYKPSVRCGPVDQDAETQRNPSGAAK
jgi:hypothetical protein